MNRRTKECDIPQKVKNIVWQRDNNRCIVCGSPYAMPNAHYIARSHGGLGIEENIITLCLRCHNKYDNTCLRPVIKEYLKNYLMSKYDNWDEEKLIYNKWRF